VKPWPILSVLAVIVLLSAVLAVVAVMSVAAVPAVLVLGLVVLALIAAGSGRRHRPGRRAPMPPVPTDGDQGVPVHGSGAPPQLRWVFRWDSRPPATTLRDTRERVSVVLAECGLTGAAVEPALLVVTELLSNAVEHADGPRWLSLELGNATVRIEVGDDTPEPPQLQPPEPLRVRGRGLQLVEAVSSQWGWVEDAPGKVVWAEVPTRWPS
jgi:anti-sigma regulatory factor (Ser/Thr protein kinase)